MITALVWIVFGVSVGLVGVLIYVVYALWLDSEEAKGRVRAARAAETPGAPESPP